MHTRTPRRTRRGALATHRPRPELVLEAFQCSGLDRITRQRGQEADPPLHAEVDKHIRTGAGDDAYVHYRGDNPDIPIGAQLAGQPSARGGTTAAGAQLAGQPSACVGKPSPRAGQPSACAGQPSACAGATAVVIHHCGKQVVCVECLR